MTAHNKPTPLATRAQICRRWLPRSREEWQRIDRAGFAQRDAAYRPRYSPKKSMSPPPKVTYTTIIVDSDRGRLALRNASAQRGGLVGGGYRGSQAPHAPQARRCIDADGLRDSIASPRPPPSLSAIPSTPMGSVTPSSVQIPPAPLFRQQPPARRTVVLHDISGVGSDAASSIAAMDELPRLAKERKQVEETMQERAENLRNRLIAHKERLLYELNAQYTLELERLEKTFMERERDLDKVIAEEDRRLQCIVQHTSTNIVWLETFSKRWQDAEESNHHVLYDEYKMWDISRDPLFCSSSPTMCWHWNEQPALGHLAGLVPAPVNNVEASYAEEQARVRVSWAVDLIRDAERQDLEFIIRLVRLGTPFRQKECDYPVCVFDLSFQKFP